MKTSRIIFAALFALAVASTSCQKHLDIELPTSPNRSATDNAVAENAFNDIFKQAEDGMEMAKSTVEGNRASYSSLTGVATVTIDPYDLVTFPKTITVDFGSTNVMCNDGKLRKGKIIIVTTGWYRDSGTVITVTPDDYYVNDNHVEGYHNITNNGHNSAGNLNYDIEVDGTVTTQEGTIYWHSDRNNEWIEGESTVFNPWDDVYLVTGTANGTNIAGEAYNWTIVSPLRVEIGCKWVTKGVLMLESGNNQLLIDYGDGNCDGLVTVTYEGTDYQIYI
jgi:archaellum component FlaF (FlaF/FlaG flagellin family)